VNGELSASDWIPIQYPYKSRGRDELAGFYRDADVGSSHRSATA
jgi:trehalose-6-phosphate synthase